MRITVTYDYQTFCRQRFGGISRYFVELGAALTNCTDISPCIFAPLHLNDYLRSYRFSKKAVFVSMESRFGRGLRPINDFLLKTMNRTFRADLIHQTYYSEFKPPTGSAIVVTVHDMTHELFPQMWSRHDKTAEYKRRAVERADHVICVSHSTKRDLMSLYRVPEAKISVTHLGVSKMVVPEASPFSSEAPYILYVGGRGGYKNFRAFLVAFASSPFLKGNFKIVAFGGGPLSSGEVDLFRNHGVSLSQIRMAAGNDAILGAAYKGAAMLVYPSLYEGFGLPPLEAMSMGCPVVASNAGPMPEVAGGAAYMSDPKDVDAIRHAMETVAGSTELRAVLMRKGHARAEMFSWERCARDTALVYRRLAASLN